MLVRKVPTGDSIEVTGVGRVRLLGVAEPFGREATDRLASLVLHRWVRLEYDPSRRAATNRQAYVLREDGVFVNAAIVRDGLARVNARHPLARLPELLAAERDAQRFHRGMWGVR